MVLFNTIGYQIKSLMQRSGLSLLELLVSGYVERQTSQDIAIALSFSPELGGKILLLKTLNTIVIEHVASSWY